jgi:sugar phosphate isomerase/epimerase
MSRMHPTVSRRRLLCAAAAGVATHWLGSRALAAPPAGVDLKLGVQLWTVKDDLQRDYPGTLRQLAVIGVRRVELYELGGPPAAETRAALDAAGLECISAHVRLWELEGGLQPLIERARRIGIRTLVVPVPWMPADSLQRALAGDMLRVLAQEMTLDNWKRTAELLNSYGERLHAEGLALAYHNHNIDFKRFGDRIPYEELVAATDARHVRLELDCGWVASAGLDPVTYLKRWPHRYMGLHVKDVKAGFVPNVAMATEPTEVGGGVMDWPSILQAAYGAGVREYYIEQEPPFVRPPLESVRISFDFVAQAARRLKGD